MLSHWQPFRDLKLMFADSRRAEQLTLRSQQRIVDTVEDSVLRTEMTGLESQEEDTPLPGTQEGLKGHLPGTQGASFSWDSRVIFFLDAPDTLKCVLFLMISVSSSLNR